MLSLPVKSIQKRVLDEVKIGDAVFRGTYLTDQNKEFPCYNLPKRECDLVIAGYSTKYRLAIIDRWISLEQQVLQNNPPFDAVDNAKLETLRLLSPYLAMNYLNECGIDTSQCTRTRKITTHEGTLTPEESILSLWHNKPFWRTMHNITQVKRRTSIFKNLPDNKDVVEGMVMDMVDNGLLIIKNDRYFMIA